tara:strand:- start:1504 stop:1722 length:219 start_codon:yes stop_codon:yes gene_type:complete
MPGHNTVFELGQDQTGTDFQGKFLKIYPGTLNSTDGEKGYGKGALGVDVTNGKFYINNGDVNASDWNIVLSS